MVAAGVPDRRRGRRAAITRARDLLTGYAELPAEAGRPVRHPAAEGRRGRRQRHGRAHRARPCSTRPARSTWCRCTSSWTARSRTTRPTRSIRRTWSTCRPRSPSTGADIGLAFDGDADRCFVVDERGELVSPSALTALVASRELATRARCHGHPQPDHLAGGAGDHRRARRHPGAHPGRALVHQGRDGPHQRDLRRRALRPLLLPRLLVRRHRHAGRAARAGRARRQDGPLSELLARYSRYAACGEINSTVERPGGAAPPQVRADLRRPSGGDHRRARRADRAAPDWWFNLRPSNTEPLLRLNVEAADQATMESLRDEVLGLVRGTPGRER